MSEFILKGASLQSPPINKGFAEFFFELGDKIGDKIFQVCGHTGIEQTYSEVRQKSVRVALFLRQFVQSKDIVLICCRNNLDNIIPVFAAQFLGCIIASVDPKQTVDEVKHVINLLQPKVIIMEKDSQDLIEKTLSTNKPNIIVIGNTAGKYPDMHHIQTTSADGETTFLPIPQQASDISTIVFSSGTTNLPKGILLSNRYLLDIGPALIQSNGLNPVCLMHFASLYWVSGWLMTAVTLCSGGRKVVSPNVDGEKFLEIVHKYKVTSAVCSNFSYQVTRLPQEVIDKYDTSSLFSLLLGGCTVDPIEIQRMRQCFPHTYVNLTYGSSEANFISIFDLENNSAESLDKMTSSGTILPGVQIKIVDLNTGELAPPNHEGEIRVKTPFGMSGYYNHSNPEVYDSDGFLKVGDIGYYDSSHYLYVTDRLSELFKYRIYQISPTFLENVLTQHPAVAEAVVFGVPQFGAWNHPAACVILEKGMEVSENELVEFVEKKVPDQYRLRGGVMVVQEEFPKMPNGKYRRRMVRDEFVRVRKSTEKN